MIYINYGAEQYLFDFCLYAIRLLIRVIFRAIVYSPLLITGYIIATRILNKTNHAIVWIIVIVLFATILYQLVYLIKGIIVALKSKNNYLWILLFIACIGFTCVFPAWLLTEAMQGIIFTLSKENSEIISVTIALVFGLYIYSRYLFLTDISPSFAYPAYQLGKLIVLKLL
jgi:hypothetical protein